MYMTFNKLFAVVVVAAAAAQAGAEHSVESLGAPGGKQSLLTMRRRARPEQPLETQDFPLDGTQDLQALPGDDLSGDSVLPAQRINATRNRVSMLSSSPSSSNGTGAVADLQTGGTSNSWLSSGIGFAGFLTAGATEELRASHPPTDKVKPVTRDRDALDSKTRRSLARISKALKRIDVASKSLEPLEEAIYARKPQYQEAQDAWQHIKMARRHQWHPKSSRDRGMATFRSSAAAFEWAIFFVALPFLVMLHYHLIEWPSTKVYHALALFIWLLVAALYATVIWIRLGTEAGIAWTTGYILEFIFSIENIFVFHIVISAFKTPIKLTQRALFIVICCQAAFQMVFYMGLAHWLRSLEVLPYILGVWLLYVGVESLKEENHGQIHIKDMMGYRVFSRVLGNRLSPEYEEDGLLIFKVKGRLYVSLLAVVTACLLTVDFLLEIDVTLTKIEELDNEYLAFTSSVVAAFAAPELFFVARDLFQRYHLLKFGVSFVLIFFGMQMLCHKFFTMPELLGCGIIVVVMICCIIASHAAKYKRGVPQYRESESIDN